MTDTFGNNADRFDNTVDNNVNRVDGTQGYDNGVANNYGVANNSTYDYDRYYGLKVVDPSGDKIGDVGQVYLDDQTGRPEWVTVRTGLFGMKETFVPLQGETIEGDEIRVPYSKDQVKGAPSIDPEGHLSEAEEAELYRYYSVSDQRSDRNYGDRNFADTTTNRDYAAGTTTGLAAGTAAAGTADYDRDRVATDRVDTDRVATDRVDTERDFADRDRVATDVNRDANLEGGIVRHEERLNVGTERVESGRVRIRKHVVHEQQSVQVPVSHEEVRVERTPIADGEVVNDGARLEEGEQDIVLHEERPVVSKETVGVERINVGTEQVRENRTVTEDIAKEQIDVEQEGTTARNGFADDYRDGDLRDGDLNADGTRKASLKDRIEGKIDDMRDKH